MTLDELNKSKATDLSTNGWLRELCLQIASKPAEVAVIEPAEKRGPGRPRFK